MKKFALLFTGLFFFPIFCFAFSFEKFSDQKPNGFVTQGAEMFLTPELIEDRLVLLEKTTGAEFAVVTIPALPPTHTLEDFSVELFKKWGIGKKEKDNGLLLLISKNDKKFRLEVGYGLEGDIPDLLAARLADAYLLPEFKKGNYDKGVLNLIGGIQKILNGTSTQMVITEARSQGVNVPGWFLFAAILWVFLFQHFLKNPVRAIGMMGGIPLAFLLAGFFGLLMYFFILLFTLMRTGTTGGTSGGWSSIGGGGFSGGSGFGGFGGGMSGGGGVSGSW